MAVSLSLAACAPQSPDHVARREPDPSTVATAERESVDTPKGWNQLLPYDGIHPIYDPQSARPDEIELQDSELIMGVTWGAGLAANPQLDDLRIVLGRFLPRWRDLSALRSDLLTKGLPQHAEIPDFRSLEVGNNKDGTPLRACLFVWGNCSLLITGGISWV